jgi:hypothetical protein
MANSEISATEPAPWAWKLARPPFGLPSGIVDEVDDVLLVRVRTDWEVVMAHVQGVGCRMIWIGR